MRFIGFHGTSTPNYNEIKRSGFILSHSPEDWMGHGVYFFINGISSAHECAIDWAKNKYADNACVLKCEILTSNYLDLRKIKNLKLYNDLKNEILMKNYSTLKERRDLRIKKRKDIRLDDSIISKEIDKILQIDTKIHNLYIKKSINRNLELESSYPNCTALCVNNIDIIRLIGLVK